MYAHETLGLAWFTQLACASDFGTTLCKLCDPSLLPPTISADNMCDHTPEILNNHNEGVMVAITVPPSPICYKVSVNISPMTHGYDISIMHDGAISPIVEQSLVIGFANKLTFNNYHPQPIHKVTFDVKDGYDDAQPTNEICVSCQIRSDNHYSTPTVCIIHLVTWLLCGIHILAILLLFWENTFWYNFVTIVGHCCDDCKSLFTIIMFLSPQYIFSSIDMNVQSFLKNFWLL